MKEQVARIIQHCICATIRAGKPVKGNVLGKNGKAAAIDTIWRDRDDLFLAFQMADDKVEFARSLPWIGNVTKWHFAKNLGVDCAKPDIHLERVASHYQTTLDALWPISPPQPAIASQQLMLRFGAPVILVS